MSAFDADADRAVYLDLLRERAGQYRLLIWAWCVMDNHIHLLAVPQHSDSLHRALGRTHADYARYLNAKRRSCGHLWQARFFSCVVAPKYLWTTMAYIEKNPVRAGIVREAEQYRWSSATSHITGTDTGPVSSDGGMAPKIYAKRDGQMCCEARWMLKRLTSGFEKLRCGCPLGDKVFPTHVESILGHGSLQTKEPFHAAQVRFQFLLSDRAPGHTPGGFRRLNSVIALSRGGRDDSRSNVPF
jgi:REP element-mobilizing transposase RayT